MAAKPTRKSKQERLTKKREALGRKEKPGITINEEIRKYLNLPYEVVPIKIKNKIDRDNFKRAQNMIGVKPTRVSYYQDQLDELLKLQKKLQEKQSREFYKNDERIAKRLKELKGEIEALYKDLKFAKKHNKPKAVRDRERKKRREFIKELRKKELNAEILYEMQKDAYEMSLYENQPLSYRELVPKEIHELIAKYNPIEKPEKPKHML